MPYVGPILICIGSQLSQLLMGKRRGSLLTRTLPLLPRARVLRVALLLCIALATEAGSAEPAPNRELGPAETARAVQNTSPMPRDLTQLAEAYRGLRNVAKVVNADQPAYQVGRRDTFWISTQSPPVQTQAAA